MADAKKAESSNGNSKKRTVGTPFQKGKSGNPGGRPKMTEVDKKAKEILKAATPAAAALVVQMVNNPDCDNKTRLRAAEVVMERVWGKAAQPIEGSMENKIEVVLGGAKKYVV